MSQELRLAQQAQIRGTKLSSAYQTKMRIGANRDGMGCAAFDAEERSRSRWLTIMRHFAPKPNRRSVKREA